jgi:hypothetical protein
MATKAFQKGELATLFGSWDNKGTVYFRQAVVYSCGSKRMILTDEATGEEIGREFAPVRAESLENVTAHNWQATFPRMTDAEAESFAIAAGAKVVEAMRVFCEGRKVQFADAGDRYIEAMNESIAELHEPRAMRR